MRVCFVDELPFGFGWIHPEPPYMQRASHALAVGGRVFLFDPTDVEGIDERIRALGEPAGVVQAFVRHSRDGKALAERLGVPFHRMSLGDAPFEEIRISEQEVAVWWPERRTLVVGEAVGTANFDRAAFEPLGVHPAMRFRPPRVLLDLEPEHILVGHGQGVHGPQAARALHRAIRRARVRAPLLALNLLPGFPRG